MNRRFPALVLTLSCLLAACQNTTPFEEEEDFSLNLFDEVPPVATPEVVSGRVIDGYVQNAFVWVDINGDFQFNQVEVINVAANGEETVELLQEPSALSGEAGLFNIAIAPSFITADNLDVAESPLVALVLSGLSIDEDDIIDGNATLGLTDVTYPLLAPPGSDVITPLTTLIQVLADVENVSTEEADDLLRDAFNTNQNLFLDYVLANNAVLAAYAEALVATMQANLPLEFAQSANNPDEVALPAGVDFDDFVIILTASLLTEAASIIADVDATLATLNGSPFDVDADFTPPLLPLAGLFDPLLEVTKQSAFTVGTNETLFNFAAAGAETDFGGFDTEQSFSFNVLGQVVAADIDGFVTTPIFGPELTLRHDGNVAANTAAVSSGELPGGGFGFLITPVFVSPTSTFSVPSYRLLNTFNSLNQLVETCLFEITASTPADLDTCPPVSPELADGEVPEVQVEKITYTYLTGTNMLSTATRQASVFDVTPAATFAGFIEERAQYFYDGNELAQQYLVRFNASPNAGNELQPVSIAREFIGDYLLSESTTLPLETPDVEVRRQLPLDPLCAANGTGDVVTGSPDTGFLCAGVASVAAPDLTGSAFDPDQFWYKFNPLTNDADRTTLYRRTVGATDWFDQSCFFYRDNDDGNTEELFIATSELLSAPIALQFGDAGQCETIPLLMSNGVEDPDSSATLAQLFFDLASDEVDISIDFFGKIENAFDLRSNTSFGLPGFEAEAP